MTIRRVAVLIFIVALGAMAAFGSTITPSFLPSPAVLNSAYGPVALSVLNPPAGTPTWSFNPPNPVQGLTIDPGTGVISGTPSVAGTYSFYVTAHYSVDVIQPYTLLVSATGTTLTMANPAPVSGAVGNTVSMQFTATGGVTPYTYALLSGTLPPGLSLFASTGLVTGTATTAGTYTPTILVTDSATPTHAIATATGTITITPTVTTLTMANPASFAGAAGNTVSMQFTASGGVTPYTYALLSGAVPGLSLNTATGLLTGPATTAGTYTPLVQVTDSTTPTAQVAQAIGTVTITAAVTMANPASVTGTVGNTASMQFTASGGTTPYTYTLLSGTFPPGLSFSSSTPGLVTGTATTAGTYIFTVQATDSTSPTHQTASATGTITINAVPTTLVLPNPTNVSGATGQNVGMQFTATGGTRPYTYTLQSGSTLPTGLTLNATTGAVTGNPTQGGSFTFTIQVADSSVPQATATGTGTINILGLTANPTPVSGVVGQTLSMQFTATGGTACSSPASAYTYALVAGSLPPGLVLDPQTGAITGQATQANTYTFLISAKDCSSPVLTATATGAITVTLLSISGVSISPSGTLNANTQPTVTLTLATAPVEAIAGTLTVNFSRTFDGQGSREVRFSNSAPAIQFTIAAGSTQATFPGGPVSLIVGTAAGFGTITVTFQDALGNNVTSPTVQPVIFSVNGTAPVITSFKISLPVGNVYTATVVGYSSTLDMASGVFNFTPTSGTNLAASSVTVSLSSAFTGWYGSSQSNQYGGQFRLTVPFAFSVTGGANSNPIVAATVTLTNAKGSTTSPSAVPQ